MKRYMSLIGIVAGAIMLIAGVMYLTSSTAGVSGWGLIILGAVVIGATFIARKQMKAAKPNA